MSPPDPLLSISEVAAQTGLADRPAQTGLADRPAQTGLAVHTLRYYERAGLMLAPIHRASSSHRAYCAPDITWIILLTRLPLFRKDIPE